MFTCPHGQTHAQDLSRSRLWIQRCLAALLADRMICSPTTKPGKVPHGHSPPTPHKKKTPKLKRPICDRSFAARAWHPCQLELPPPREKNLVPTSIDKAVREPSRLIVSDSATDTQLTADSCSGSSRMTGSTSSGHSRRHHRNCPCHNRQQRHRRHPCRRRR